MLACIRLSVSAMVLVNSVHVSPYHAANMLIYVTYFGWLHTYVIARIEMTKPNEMNYSIN